MSEVLIEATEAGIRAELEARRRRRENAARYARDPLLWIDDSVYIASKFADGELVGRVRPIKMILWPDQRETIAQWLDLEYLLATGELRFNNLLLEKSRQIGETWGIAAVVRWLLRYHRFQGLYMHTQGGEVYDRDLTARSFFGRVKFIDEHLADRNELIFRPFSKDPAIILAADTRSALFGELQRDDPGRGGTFDFALIDEAAHVTHGESVHSAISSAAASGKFYLSTPWGDDNMHARLCDDRPAGWRYLRLHWSTHPVYSAGLHVAGVEAEAQPTPEMGEAASDCAQCRATRAGFKWTAQEPLAHRYPGKLTSPWYENEILDKTDEQVASELDIDRAGALTARVYGEFDRSIHMVPGGIEYDPAIRLECGWDFGLDCTAVPVIQNAPMEVRVIGLLECGDKFPVGGMPDAVAPALAEYAAQLGIDESALRAARHIGDPAGGSRELTSAGVFAAYREQGIVIMPPPRQWTRRVDFSVSSVKNLLLGRPKPVRVCGVNARVFSRHMLNNTWPTDAQGRRRPQTPGQGQQPLDNVHNHACRAFAYWAVATYPPAGRRRTKHGGASKVMLPPIAGVPGGGRR